MTTQGLISAREEVKRAHLIQQEALGRRQLNDQIRCSNRDTFDRLLSATTSSPPKSVAGESAQSIFGEARALRQAEHEARLKAHEQRYHEDVYRSKRLLLKKEREAQQSKEAALRKQKLDVELLERERKIAEQDRDSWGRSLTPLGTSEHFARDGRATTSPLRVHKIKHRAVTSQSELAEKQRQQIRETRDLVERRRLENLERLRQVERENSEKEARKAEEIEILAQMKAEEVLQQKIDEKRHHFEKLDEMKHAQREKEAKRLQAAAAEREKLQAAQLLTVSPSRSKQTATGDDEGILSPRRQMRFLLEKELEVRRGKISADLWNAQFHAVSKKLEEDDKRRALEEKKRKGDEIRKKQVENFSNLVEKRQKDLREREAEYMLELQRAHQAVIEQEIEQQRFVKNLKEQGRVLTYEKSAEMEAKKAGLVDDVHLAREKSIMLFQEMSMEAREQLQTKIHDAEVAHQKRIRSLEKQKLAEYKASLERVQLEAKERQLHEQEQREKEAARFRHLSDISHVHEKEKLNSHLFRQFVSEVKQHELKNTEVFYQVKQPEKRPRPYRQDLTPTNKAMLPPVVPPHPELKGFDFASDSLMKEITAELNVADSRVKSLQRSMR